MGASTGNRADFLKVANLVRQGAIRGIVSRTFPLEDAAEAHRAMEGRDCVREACAGGALEPLTPYIQPIISTYILGERYDQPSPFCWAYLAFTCRSIASSVRPSIPLHALFPLML